MRAAMRRMLMAVLLLCMTGAATATAVFACTCQSGANKCTGTQCTVTVGGRCQCLF